MKGEDQKKWRRIEEVKYVKVKCIKADTSVSYAGNKNVQLKFTADIADEPIMRRVYEK